MDQIVKERLVGMGVLLVLGVIFIPLILDGNSSELSSKSTQNLNLPVPSENITHEMSFKDGNLKKVTLPLPTTEIPPNIDGVKTASNPEEISSNVAEEPTTPKTVPSSGFIDELPDNSITNAQAEKDSEVTIKTTQAIDRTASIANPPKSQVKNSSQSANVLAASAWVVQIGSFGDRKNAENEVASLKAKGFPAFMRRFVTAEQKALYRVRVGPEKERARAEKLFERLSKAGIIGQIVQDP